MARLEPSESRSFRTGGQARPRCWYISSVVAFGESRRELLSFLFIFFWQESVFVGGEENELVSTLSEDVAEKGEW